VAHVTKKREKSGDEKHNKRNAYKHQSFARRRGLDIWRTLDRGRLMARMLLHLRDFEIALRLLAQVMLLAGVSLRRMIIAAAVRARLLLRFLCEILLPSHAWLQCNMERILLLSLCLRLCSFTYCLF
jgi:hypothetical protein